MKNYPGCKELKHLYMSPDERKPGLICLQDITWQNNAACWNDNFDTCNFIHRKVVGVNEWHV